MKQIIQLGKAWPIAGVLACSLALAQVEVKSVQAAPEASVDLQGESTKLDLGSAAAGSTSSLAQTQGQYPVETASGGGATLGTPPPPGTYPAAGAKHHAGSKASKPSPARPKLLGALEGSSTAATEATARIQRVQFDRSPVKVSLAVNTERQVTFPNPVALHVPAGSEALVWTQVIERTAFLRAMQPIAGTRVIAEDLATGQMVPVDLYAEDFGGPAPGELEVFYKSRSAGGRDGAGRSRRDDDEGGEDEDYDDLDMVGLTRYAAQSLYAPKRIAPNAPGVYPVPVSPKAFQGLIRGQRTSATPLGQWRSGELFVTAVKVTNLETRAINLDLDQLRGSWLAATPQHRRLLQADSSWNTTTLYLVCAGAFETCR